MDACCENEAKELLAMRQRRATVLRIVLVASLVMFIVEFGAGLWSASTALQADSLDMLSDAFVYAFSLHVLHRSSAWRARAALVKGLLMAGLGIAVLGGALIRLHVGAPPIAPAMAVFAGLAFGTNALCFGLLYRYRTDDINLRSTWLCTRNDLVANIAVVVAAVAVARTGSIWPDLVVGGAVAALFLRTSAIVVREAAGELWAPAASRTPIGSG